MAVLLANNATSRLASSLTAGATALSVTSGEGAKFPSPTGADWFPLTLIKSSGALEILRCTARSGDVFTVTRAQEGTAAQAFSAGDRVEVRLTKAVMDAIVQQINDLTNSALLDANNLSDLTNAATARGNLGLGTAATKNAQTSPTDPSVEALMLVGAFGLGGSVVSLVVPNLDDDRATGFYYCNSPTNGPADGGNGWLMQFRLANGEYATQTYIAYSPTPRVFQRTKTAPSTWGAWVEALNTGNVSPFAQTLLDDANAAAARATLDVYSKAEANSIAIGVGQTWQDVTASRESNTTYTNTTGKPIQYCVSFGYVGNGTASLKVGGVVVNSFTFSLGGTGASLSAIVPAGSTYSASGAKSRWTELR